MQYAVLMLLIVLVILSVLILERIATILYVIESMQDQDAPYGHTDPEENAAKDLIDRLHRLQSAKFTPIEGPISRTNTHNMGSK